MDQNKRISQYYQPNAPQNVLIQPGQDGLGSVNNGSGALSPQELYGILENVVKNPTLEANSSSLDDALQKATNPEMKTKIKRIIDALKFEGNGKPPTRNLDTGEYYKTGPDKAKALMEELKPMINEQESNQVTAQVKKRNKDKDKDKKRGNPFQVLLGQIGKLKDHGASNQEVKKFLKKDGVFDTDLIEKAIKVYEDLQKKKTKKAFVLSEYRVALAAKKQDATLYDVEPEWSKRSTNELMARLGWLKSLEGMTTATQQGEGREAFSKEGAKEEIAKIKKALRARGFEDSEL